MNLKISIYLIICCNIILASSCNFLEPAVNGNGKVLEVTREVASFNKISVSRGLDVHLVQGPEKQVKVKADENLLDIIETKVVDSNLKITTSSNIRKFKSKKIFITVPSLKSIKSFAGSRVYADDKLKVKNLEITSSAGSLVKLNIEVSNLSAKASAGSNIKLEGNSVEFTAKASSGSNINAKELNVSSCDAKVSSGANIWLYSNNKINAHASSGGNIFYLGNPKIIETSKSSGGNIIKK